jgi:hypothetical protein
MTISLADTGANLSLFLNGQSVMAMPLPRRKWTFVALELYYGRIGKKVGCSVMVDEKVQRGVLEGVGPQHSLAKAELARGATGLLWNPSAITATFSNLPELSSALWHSTSILELTQRLPSQLLFHLSHDIRPG